MNTNFFKQVSFLLGLTALCVLGGGLSAQAETPDAITDMETAVTVDSEPVAVEAATDPAAIPLTESNPAVAALGVQIATESTASVLPQDSSQEKVINENADATAVPSMRDRSAANATGTAADLVANKPFPDASTSAAALTQPQQTSSETRSQNKVAQTDIELGRATRSGRSYIGAGVNIGFGGDTALGDGSFAIISKIGLSNTLSVRPSVLIGDDATFLIPVTYDFNIRQTDPFETLRFAPYVGGGVTISTGDDSTIGFLATGGVDVPLSREFTATAALNVGFQDDEIPVGLMVGVGYTFSGF
ncbi:hypothetical protein H6F61_14830 [Cyanobacteria bacterium FACHB-472]|nr:hypothetical protein [Cyanobacteria bacterium FACHB-472]